MSDERFTFASPLPESWLLLLIISRHHAGISIAATHGHLRLLLLLLLRHVEAIHVALLAARVEIIILLISIHVLLDELVRWRGRHWRRWLHHLGLANVLAIHVDAGTGSIELRVGRRLLVNEVLRSLEAIALTARSHHETTRLALHSKLSHGRLVNVRQVAFILHVWFVDFRVNWGESGRARRRWKKQVRNQITEDIAQRLKATAGLFKPGSVLWISASVRSI